MQTPKGRSGSEEGPKRISPSASRQLKTTGLDSASASASASASSPIQAKIQKDKCPKVAERRSPRSPISEKKRPSRITELESQVIKLQEELKKAKQELNLSESWKKQAMEDANISKKQLLTLSMKLEQSQKHMLKLSSSHNTHVIEEVQNISQEKDQVWQSEIDLLRQQYSFDSASLTSVTSEIKQLKDQLEIEAVSEATQNKQAESADLELQALKTKLRDALSLVENMKNLLRNSKESEANAQALASDTLVQLESAKQSVDALRSEGKKVLEEYNLIAVELELSRGQVKSLEAIVSKLEEDLRNSVSKHSNETADNHHADAENQKQQDVKLLEAEICSLKSEMELLRSTLEAAEIKCNEEKIKNTAQLRSAFEEIEQVKSLSFNREAELEAEIKQANAKIEELKAELMDKETELQGISEENEGLNMKLNQSLSSQRVSVLDSEAKNLKENLMRLKTALVDKETELQNILEENKVLKAELSKGEVNGGRLKDDMIKELEAARAAKEEALTKLGLIMEEAEKGNRRLDRAMEQLEAAQLANSEMEAELRRIKVQSNQWRKAAEAAVSMLSAGNNVKVMDKTASLDTGKIDSPYHEDLDEDMLKKKNGNMLKKIGVLWKKPQK